MDVIDKTLIPVKKLHLGGGGILALENSSMITLDTWLLLLSKGEAWLQQK